MKQDNMNQRDTKQTKSSIKTNQIEAKQTKRQCGTFEILDFPISRNPGIMAV